MGCSARAIGRRAKGGGAVDYVTRIDELLNLEIGAPGPPVSAENRRAGAAGLVPRQGADGASARRSGHAGRPRAPAASFWLADDDRGWRTRPRRATGRNRSSPSCLNRPAQRTDFFHSIRRSDHPRRPSARTCCPFSLAKTLLMPSRNVQFPAGVNVSGRYPKWPVFKCPLMAGFGCPPRGRAASVTARPHTGADGRPGARSTGAMFSVCGGPAPAAAPTGGLKTSRARVPCPRRGFAPTSVLIARPASYDEIGC